MKKTICMLALGMCLLPMLANAGGSTPQPPTPTTGSFTNADRANSVKGDGQAPIAPATLLLLGLAGGFAGVKVYRNNKKED